ncbi:MAG: hypothetical protein U1F14_02990 [Steroidobacteraceae bacterium]
MNKRPIEEARDPDLRNSMAAMQRAARRAREIAALTGTSLIIHRNGQVVAVDPREADTEWDAPAVHEGSPPHGRSR